MDVVVPNFRLYEESKSILVSISRLLSIAWLQVQLLQCWWGLVSKGSRRLVPEGVASAFTINGVEKWSFSTSNLEEIEMLQLMGFFL